MKNVGDHHTRDALLSTCGSPSIRSGNLRPHQPGTEGSRQSKRRQPAPDAVGRAMMPALRVDETGRH